MLNVHEQKRMEAVGMNSIRNICRVKRLDMMRNEEELKRCSNYVSVCEKFDESALKWFGYHERPE